MSQDTHAPAVADDAALVARAKGGDFAAFEELVSRHEGRVYSIAMNILRQRQDAEDATQTVFLNALEHLEGFREEAAFATWITRVAVNTALKALRKRKGLSTVPLDGGRETETGEIRHPDYIAEWRGDPAKLVAQRDLKRILDEAIEALPERHRLVFVLRDVEGLSVREAAEALGISEANVKVRLLRARLALREALTQAFGDPARRLAPDHSGTDHATAAEELLRLYENPARGRTR
ncbi:MAG TPA: sigma-70 family RNA polymerase sigma factor [Planctomycetota bacterium]|nr:sigma-70 family RNA polymerase sigma factor [Planctomycetota bacterium]HRR79490.1 sigma-70 family RNA polymerase sigma factor [Planctomycetota bacterium]HRT96750.1 sigma-70 family RNA polymerase sigma factor [Planctomycetota bacterium]